MGIIKRYFVRQYERIKAPLEEPKKNAKRLRTGIRSIVRTMRSNRSPDADDAPDLTDFNAVLDHWDIEPHVVPKVIRGLKIRTAANGVLGLAGVAVFFNAAVNQKFFLFVSGTVLISLAITTIVTSAWRIHVLKKQRFIPFKKWIKTLFADEQGA